MKLNIKFRFTDNTIVSNILEWDAKLKRGTSCKLLKFSSCANILDTLYSEKAYAGLKTGFYTLPISATYRLAMDVKQLGHGSYIICVYEPRLVHKSGLDYSFKYHLMFVGESEEFEKYVSCSKTPATTVFNGFSNNEMFDNGVSLGFLADEQEDSRMKKYLLGLVETRKTDENTKLATDTVTVGEEEEIEIYVPPVGRIPNPDSPQPKFAIYDKPNIIDYNQSVHGLTESTLKPIAGQVARFLADTTGIQEYKFPPQVLRVFGKLRPYSDSRVISSVEFRLSGDYYEISFDIEKWLSEKERMKLVNHIFKNLHASYSGIVFVNPGPTQTYRFKVRDGEKYRVNVFNLIRFKLWLELQAYGKKYFSNEEENKDSGNTDLFQNERDPKPEAEIETVARRKVVVETVDEKSDCQSLVATTLGLIRTFETNFGFIPDAYILSKLISNVAKDKDDSWLNKQLSYADLYLISKAVDMDDKPANEFDDFIKDVWKYMI